MWLFLGALGLSWKSGFRISWEGLRFSGADVLRTNVLAGFGWILKYWSLTVALGGNGKIIEEAMQDPERSIAVALSGSAPVSGEGAVAWARVQFAPVEKRDCAVKHI